MPATATAHRRYVPGLMLESTSTSPLLREFLIYIASERAQVNQLIAAPDETSPLYLRDVAILELLYACGVRASELCDLTLANLNLSVGCMRVLGKGRKERIVPVGGAACEAITNYLGECRPKLDKVRSDRLFLSPAGKPLDRLALWRL